MQRISTENRPLMSVDFALLEMNGTAVTRAVDQEWRKKKNDDDDDDDGNGSMTMRGINLIHLLESGTSSRMTSTDFQRRRSPCHCLFIVDNQRRRERTLTCSCLILSDGIRLNNLIRRQCMEKDINNVAIVKRTTINQRSRVAARRNYSWA